MFIIATYNSSDELCYYLWGEESVARVLHVRPEHSAWDDQEGDYRVTFEFRNADTGNRQQRFLVVDEREISRYPQDSEFDVQYYADSPLAWRMKGEENFYWVEFFLWCLGGSVISVVILTYLAVLEERQRDNRKWWIK